MAKNRQIKEVLVKLESKGLDSTIKGLDKVRASMETLETSAKSMSSSVTKMALGMGSIRRSAVDATEAFRALSKVLNGGTKTAEKKIQSYMDNIQLLDLELKELNTTASSVSKNLNSMITPANAQHAENLETALDAIIVTLVEMADDTKEVVRGFDRLEDSIEANVTQTKKARRAQKDHHEEIKEGTRAVKQHGIASDKTNNDVRRLGAGARSSAKSFSKLAFGANPLVTTYAAIAVNVIAVTEAFRLLTEAAAFERLQTQVAGFSAAVTGVNVKALATQLQVASGFALSLKESLSFATKGVAFNFTATQMEKLATGARKASIALGINFTDAMDRVVRGISKQEIELFDELGVVTRLIPAFEKYAGSIGKTVDQLSDFERQTALYLEVQGQLDERFSGIQVASSSFEKLSAVMKDLKDNFLILVAKGLDPAVIAFTTMVEKAQVLAALGSLDITPEEQAPTSAPTGALPVAKATVQAVSEATSSLEVLNETEKQLQKTRGQSNKSIGSYINSLSGLRNSSQSLKTAMSEVNGVMSELDPDTFGLKRSSVVLVDSLSIAAGAVEGFVGSVTPDFMNTAVVSASLDRLSEGIGDVKLTKKLKESGQQLKDSATIMQDAIDETEKQVARLLGLTEIEVRLLTEDQISGAAQFLGNINSGLVELNSASKLTAKLKSGFVDVRTAISQLNIVGGSSLSEIPKAMEESTKAFQEFSKSMELDSSVIGSWDDLLTVLDRIDHLKIIGASEAAKAVSSNAKTLGAGDLARVANLERQLSVKAELISLEESKGLSSSKQLLEIQRNSLAAVSDQLDIAKSKLIIATQTNILAMAESLFNAEISNSGRNQSEALKTRLVFLKQEHAIVVQNTTLKGQALKDLMLQQTFERGLLDIKIKQAKEAEAAALRIENITHRATILEISKNNVMDSQVQVLERQIVTAELKHAVELSNLDLTEKELVLLREKHRKELEILDAKKQQANIAINKQVDQTFAGDTEADLNKDLGNAGTEQAKVGIQQKLLDLRSAQTVHITDGVELLKEQLAIENAQETLNQAKTAAGFVDTTAVLAGMQQLQGLSDMQQSVLAGAETFTSTFSDMLAGGGDDLGEYLMGNIQAFADFASGMVNAVSSIYQGMSDERVAGYDREIEAEKRKDGKSAESLAKIKKLEAKKIKVEANAKKASIGMSTAAAIMQAMANIPYPANIAIAAATGIMGMKQMSNVDKAASGQLAALDGGGGESMKITSGNRDNSVNVSQSANAGELSFLRGDSGSGSANNFTPGRAGGGNSAAGASILVGETGPELITPNVPVTVESSGNSKMGGSINFSPVFNVNAIDATNFEDTMHLYSAELFSGLERELNAKGLSLEDLER